MSRNPSDFTFNQDSSAGDVLALFHVRAAVEPSVFQRVVEFFTLRDLIPEFVACEKVYGPEAELRIDVRVCGLTAQQTEHLASRILNLMPVVGVVAERLPMRQAA